MNFSNSTLIMWALNMTLQTSLVIQRLRIYLLGRGRGWHDLGEWPFSWCKFGFGRDFRASSQSNCWAGRHQLRYTIQFSLYVTIWSRNSSLLSRTREHDTSRQFFWSTVSSWGTHLPSFFAFPVCFKCQTTKEWATVSSRATSRVVVRGSASMAEDGSQLVITNL